MARNEIRPVVKLRSTAGTGYTYITRKNRRNDPDRLVLRKDDGEVVDCALDENTRVELADAALPAGAGPAVQVLGLFMESTLNWKSEADSTVPAAMLPKSTRMPLIPS